MRTREGMVQLTREERTRKQKHANKQKRNRMKGNPAFKQKMKEMSEKKTKHNEHLFKFEKSFGTF